MTVKELIERLKELPENMEVVDYEYNEINEAEIEIPNGYGYDYECVIVR